MTTRIRMDATTWRVLGILEDTGGIKRAELAELLGVKPDSASAYLHILSRYGMATASNIGRGAVWKATGQRCPVLRPINEACRANGLRKPVQPPPAPRRPVNSVFALGQA